MLSLIHVLDWRAAVTPDAIALSDDQRGELTFAGLAAAADQHAAAFAAAGIMPGDVVPVIARNQTGWVTAMTGLIRAGALPAAINWRLAEPELAALLDLIRPAAIACDELSQAAARRVAAVLGEPVPVLEAVAQTPAAGSARALPPRPADRLRGPSRPCCCTPAARPACRNWCR